jgi:hypothetical protein
MLDDLAKKLTAHDDPGALDALLALWRDRRDGSLLPATEALAARIVKGRPPIAGKTHKAKLEAWLALDTSRDAATVSQLLPDLFAVNAPSTRKRLERVAAWPDDPRIGNALVSQVLEEWVSMVDKPVGTAVFKLLLRHLDPTIYARLKDSRFSAIGPQTAYDGWRTERLERLAAALAKLPNRPLDADERKQLDSLCIG